jgi:hypothetical protein
MFVLDNSSRHMTKIIRIYRGLSSNNFATLQRLEAANVRKNTSPMSENLLLVVEYVTMPVIVKV